MAATITIETIATGETVQVITEDGGSCVSHDGYVLGTIHESKASLFVAKSFDKEDEQLFRTFRQALNWL